MRSSIYILSLLIVSAGCREEPKEIKAEVRKLTAAVYASGTLLPEREYKVVSLVDGYLTHAAVKEGDTIRKGELLFTIGNDVREAQERGARATLSRTLPAVSDNSPAIQELENRLELSRVTLQQDSVNDTRYKNLLEQNAVSKSNYEKFHLQYQTSVKEYANIRKQLQQQKLSANLQLQQARNQLEVSATQSGAGRLRSYADGVVYDIYKEVGDFISPNQQVALIGQGQMIARLLVDEDDLSKVKPGQKVLITMDAFPDRVFEASVSRIYPVLSRVEQSFRVDARFADPIPIEMYGLNLEANIVIAENRDVLSIPRTALRKGDSVWVKQGGDIRHIRITTGLQDENWVEVKNGLTPESVIIVE